MNTKKRTTNEIKISKGYRLKPSTHKRIKMLQNSLSTNQDMIISMALNLFNKEAKTIKKRQFNK